MYAVPFRGDTGGNTREENAAFRGRLAAIRSHSGGHRRSRRSTGSAERSPSGDPCLGRGHRTAEPLPFQEKDEDVDRDSELSFARHLELEGVTSPTDPPPHASREKMREEEEKDEGAAETSGGGGGKLEHVRLFDQNAAHEDDIFGMHKPLWM